MSASQPEKQTPSSSPSTSPNPGLDVFTILFFIFIATALFGILSIVLNFAPGLDIAGLIVPLLGSVAALLSTRPDVLKQWKIVIPRPPPGLPLRLMRGTTVLLLLGVLVLDGGLIWLITHPENRLPQNFVVTSLHPGQVIQNQDVPLTITGTYFSEGSDHVWVVLEDEIGQYYLQTPPVEFLGGGQWVAHNIRPGPGITQVDFVQVTSDGNGVFQQRVDSNNFNAFNQLPNGSTILVQIRIVPQVSG